MPLQQIKKHLKSLLTSDMGKAMKKFESILNLDASLFNDLILQQGSFNGLKREQNRGIISEPNANRRQNRIRYALIEMIDMMEEEDVNLTTIESILKDKNNSPDNPPANSPTTQQEIYISYAWGGESEKIVNQLDTELQNKGITIIRDKRNLGYRGSIVEFMKSIGRGNKIIVIISKKYLESENCMFELTQVYENKDFAGRIFPIILEDAGIYNPISRLKYIKYWNNKITELDEAIKDVGTALNMTQLQQELNNYGDIRATFDQMAFILKDMNALTPEIHQNQNFQTLYDQLVS